MHTTASVVTTFLFTDIEGSARLWEQEPDRMRVALARHDAIVRSAVECHHGTVVKMMGDGMHAAFNDPLDAIGSVLQLQQALVDPNATDGLVLRVRCGLHAGVVERRDDDYFGSTVNRAARIMAAANGGQVLVSEAVVNLVRERLPGTIVLRDMGAVRLRDLTTVERLFQVVHPQLRKDFPALRSLEGAPHNLPQQVTSFVGRGREKIEIKILLGNARLLTLVGVGGIGKTRLSMQVAADVIDDYPDGVWFVELAPLADPRLVPQMVATVLGVKEDVGRPVTEALVRFVKDRTLLLVLDNCEHVVLACAQLAEALLKSGPFVKVLASSREHLHVAAEHIYQVPALSVPDHNEWIAPESLAQYEGVRLFIDRAIAARPAFEVTSQNVGAIAEICHRLDGIPLAIELAAARVRTLSVENIAARLIDRFGLLKTGSRTSLPRQQTLRALIDWSYDLLTERERAMFRQVAVFAGGWTLEAAEAVCVGRDLDQGDVLDLLAALVEKSLVVAEVNTERYRLLETVRQYAQERLDEAGDRDATRTRHLEFYLALAEEARSGLTGPAQKVWLCRLDLERENILVAHAWCDRAEDGGQLGLRLVYGIQPYWTKRGLLELGHRAIVDALKRPGAEIRNLIRCKALFAAGWLYCYMGRYRDAQAYLEQSEAIARENENSRRLAAVLQPLALVYLGQGDTTAAQKAYERAVELEEELGDDHQLAAALTGLAQTHRLEGDLDKAEQLYKTSMALAGELQDREAMAIGHLNLAMVSIGRGLWNHARRMLMDAVAIADDIGSNTVGQSILEVSAGLAALREEWESAARFFGAAEAHAAKTGLHRDPTDEAFLAPLIARARDTIGGATFAASELTGRSLSYPAAITMARLWLQDQA